MVGCCCAQRRETTTGFFPDFAVDLAPVFGTGFRCAGVAFAVDVDAGLAVEAVVGFATFVDFALDVDLAFEAEGTVFLAPMASCAPANVRDNVATVREIMMKRKGLV